ncbi:MAG: single-stranded-DNA-specific exonuclease RecJ [Bacteroidia bacterium]
MLAGYLFDWVHATPETDLFYPEDIPPLIQKSLWARGILPQHVRSFFEPVWEDLHNPFLMKGITPAAQRLAQALEKKEKILVVGDYDVDGTCSTAMTVLYLRQRGIPCSYHLPNRFEEGYGVSLRAAQKALQEKVDLVLTLDCGTNDHPALEYLKAQGIPVIICDHHEVQGAVAPHYAFLNPKQPGETYPFRDLCGAGVTYKLLCAVERLRQGTDAPMKMFLPYVGVATACDQMPLRDENRTLVALGMQALNAPTFPGWQALLQASGLQRIHSTRQLVFHLGPRLNAPGRLEDPQVALELLITPSVDQAHLLAQKLNEYNSQRQKLQDTCFHQAIQKFPTPPQNGIVLWDKGWSKGIVGIVASHVREHFNLPTILLAPDKEGRWTGSGRSTPDVALHQVAEELYQAGLLERFGGHAHAIGLTVSEEKLPLLEKAFADACRKKRKTTPARPTLSVEGVVGLGEFLELARPWLAKWEPVGNQNPRPTFIIRDFHVRQLSWYPYQDPRHGTLKLLLAQDKVLEARWQNAPAEIPTLLKQKAFQLALAYDPHAADGPVKAQIKDVHVSEG